MLSEHFQNQKRFLKRAISQQRAIGLQILFKVADVGIVLCHTYTGQGSYAWCGVFFMFNKCLQTCMEQRNTALKMCNKSFCPRAKLVLFWYWNGVVFNTFLPMAKALILGSLANKLFTVPKKHATHKCMVSNCRRVNFLSSSNCCKQEVVWKKKKLEEQKISKNVGGCSTSKIKNLRHTFCRYNINAKLLQISDG